ncbi:Fic family protein [candidate division WOR-3 bacterium]|nr:Fic family protein [candidate division WOR-3 bacterium]
MRTYERTHPWIKFSLDLRQADHKLWLALGEVQAKCEYLAGLPLQPATAGRLHKIYLAKGALATTAIEGNTLSEEEALKLVEGKLTLPPSKEYLAQEVKNIIDACNRIGNELLEKEDVDDLCVDKIKEFNRLVLKDLELPEEVIPGEIRDYPVVVTRYQGTPPGDCEYLLKRLCDFLNEERFRAPKGDEIVFGLIRAILAHLYLAWIHPFGDGNGRTARLMEFQILLAAGAPTLAVHLLSNHYNLTRQEYYRQLDRASQSGGEVFPFIKYAVRGFLDGLNEQMQVIQIQVLDVSWRDYVHGAFKDKPGEVARRRRHLALDLSYKEEPVPLSEIRHISPRLAEAYAGKTAKTVTRDVNALVEMDLVEPTPKGIRAKREKMLGFLPKRRTDSVE